jgi:hypothetical protein
MGEYPHSTCKEIAKAGENPCSQVAEKTKQKGKGFVVGCYIYLKSHDNFGSKRRQFFGRKLEVLV